MVKADLDRDYYADLEIDSNASTNEIRKQFRKLALLYHPDRNLGKESDITAKFQAIQSAHEVLTDPAERARYDEARSRFRYTTASAFRAHTRGNPYSNYGSEFPRPPKPPPTRSTRNPPQSAGAARYAGFQTPKQPPSATAQEGAEARKSTFHAWESMKGHQKASSSSSSYRTGPGSSWSTPKAVPKEHTPQSGREESNSYKHPPPPKAKPGYDEFRSGQASGSASYFSRNQSTTVPRKNGFNPSNPGLDEPAAARGNYFTSRSHRMAPEPPPRDGASDDKPPVNHSTRPSVNTADPLRQFRETEDAPFEPRLSTPYANAGGEKFDPFDTANLSRSKSTREGFSTSDTNKKFNRSGSDPNLSSPPPNIIPKPTVSEDSFADSDTDSDIRKPQKSRVFAKPRKVTPAKDQQEPLTAAGTQSQRKPNSLSTFQQWLRNNPNAESEINGFHPDGPQTNDSPPKVESKAESKAEPSMYGRSPRHSLPNSKERIHHVKSATVSGAPFSHHPLSLSSHMQNVCQKKYPAACPNSGETAPPSGASTHTSSAFKSSEKFGVNKSCFDKSLLPRDLHPFEAVQHSLVDQLLLNKQQAERIRRKTYAQPAKSITDPIQNDVDIATPIKIPTTAEMSNSVEKPDFVNKCQSTSLSTEPPYSSLVEKLYAHANNNVKTSFSMNLDDETFSPTQPVFPRGSVDNINTKFSSEEWDGKFEAGNYFVPEQKTTQIPFHSRTRAQSHSRSRGRSPIKVRPVDPKVFPASKPDTPIESPGGTKFSAQEWEETFKPQTFAPPSFASASKPAVPPRLGSRKPRASVTKPTTGSAAIVIDSDEDDSSDEKPLFMGRAGKAPQTPATGSSSPDAMDVDTPPLAPHTQPQAQPETQSQNAKANENLNINTEPLKRAAAPSMSPVDSETLKADFEDLKIHDILSSIELPRPPAPPRYSQEEHTPMAQGIYLSAFTAYMGDWDLFVKQMMLHLVARKNQNDALGSDRWENGEVLDTYRHGLKEDGVVLSHWVAAMAAHDQVMKEYAIHKARFSAAPENGERRRLRKKTH